jgi:4-hydroxy-tetrahydrodipicolinate synthase
MAKLCNFALQNDFSAARKIHVQYLPLMEVNFVESNPIPVKAAMAKMGLLQAVWRLPLVPPSASSMERIQAVLETLGLIEKTYAAVGD